MARRTRLTCWWSSLHPAVKKEDEEEEEQKIEEEEENKKEETTPGEKGEGEGEKKKTTESDDGAETTTVDGNGGAGDDVAMEDKKEPVGCSSRTGGGGVQIKQEKAGSGSDGTTTIGQDPLHAFALTLGSDSKAVKKLNDDEKNTKAPGRTQTTPERRKSGACKSNRSSKSKNANVKSRFNNSSNEKKCSNNACLRSKRKPLSRSSTPSWTGSIRDCLPEEKEEKEEETAHAF